MADDYFLKNRSTIAIITGGTQGLGLAIAKRLAREGARGIVLSGRNADKDGFFERSWQAGLAEYDAFNGIDWSWLSMEGAMSKAPLAGEKNRAQSRGPQQAGHQTLAVGGGQRRARGLSRRWRQQKRLQALGGDAPEPAAAAA